MEASGAADGDSKSSALQGGGASSHAEAALHASGAGLPRAGLHEVRAAAAAAQALEAAAQALEDAHAAAHGGQPLRRRRHVREDGRCDGQASAEASKPGAAEG